MIRFWSTDVLASDVFGPKGDDVLQQDRVVVQTPALLHIEMLQNDKPAGVCFSEAENELGKITWWNVFHGEHGKELNHEAELRSRDKHEYNTECMRL